MHHVTKYPRTLHLDDSGLGWNTSARDRLSWTDIRHRNVVLEEKMDGAETSFEFDGDATPILRFRGSALDLGLRGGAERPFDRLKDWFLLRQDALFERFENRYRVYGEWLYSAHRIFYDALPDHFMEFDILDNEAGGFLDTPSRHALLEAGGIHSVRVMYAGKASGSAHPSLLDLRSAFRSDRCAEAAARSFERGGNDLSMLAGRFDDTRLMEGIYGKIEEDGRVIERFKWVRPGFVSAIVEAGRHWRDMAPAPNLLRE